MGVLMLCPQLTPSRLNPADQRAVGERGDGQGPLRRKTLWGGMQVNWEGSVGTFGFLWLSCCVMSLCILFSANSFYSLFGPRQQTHYTAPLWKGRLSIPQSVTKQGNLGLSFLGGGRMRGERAENWGGGIRDPGPVQRDGLWKCR